MKYVQKYPTLYPIMMDYEPNRCGYLTYDSSSYKPSVIDTNQLKYTQAQISFSDKLMDDIMYSKEYAHFILNQEFLNKLLRKEIPLSFHYAWATLHLEEMNYYHRTIQNPRFWIDIRTASQLPQSTPWGNPYLVLNVANSREVLKRNIHGRTIRADGICTKEEFLRRVNLFIWRNESDILEGLDWSRMVLCGGAMAATVPNYPEDRLDDIFHNLYGESDIDMACRTQTTIGFIRHTYQTTTQIHRNIRLVYPEAPEPNVSAVHHAVICVDYYIALEKFYLGEIRFSPDEIMERRHDLDIKEEIYQIYSEAKLSYQDTDMELLGVELEKFQICTRPCDLDHFTVQVTKNFDETVFRGEFVDNGTDIHAEFEIEDYGRSFARVREHYKFQIESEYLAKNIELFQTPYKATSLTMRSHFPCARAYYDGETCWMLPSAVAAYMTGINLHFKFFLGTVTPIHLIHKYRSRGYGTILNANEIEIYTRYAMQDEILARDYRIQDKSEAKARDLILTEYTGRLNPIVDDSGHIKSPSKCNKN